MGISMCACGSPYCKHCNPNIWTDPHSEVNTSYKDKRIAELEAKLHYTPGGDCMTYEELGKAFGEVCDKLERLERVETVARQLTDGSHPCFVENHEKCKHERYGYEGCEQCYDEALLEALEESSDE